MNAAAKRPVNLSPELWLEHTQSDLKLARLGCNQDILPEQICFHAQQSVEKSLKAVMLAFSVDFPFSHDIQELVETMADAGITLPNELQDLDALTPYAVETRYPGYWGVISESDVTTALDLAQNNLTWAKGYVSS